MIYTNSIDELKDYSLKIAEIKIALRKIVDMDDKYSDDERALILNINKNLLAYDELITKIIEDNFIDENEYQQLREAESSILTDAENVARKDKLITKEEEDILSTLSYYINNIQNLKFENTQ